MTITTHFLSGNTDIGTYFSSSIMFIARAVMNTNTGIFDVTIKWINASGGTNTNTIGDNYTVSGCLQFYMNGLISSNSIAVFITPDNTDHNISYTYSSDTNTYITVYTSVGRGNNGISFSIITYYLS